MIKVPLCRFQQSLVPFARFFLKRPLKQDFTDIYLTNFLEDGNLGNTSAMRVISFSKCVAFNVDFKNQRKSEKKSFVSEIIVFELVFLNFLYKEENTSHRQSMSYLTV